MISPSFVQGSSGQDGPPPPGRRAWQVPAARRALRTALVVDDEALIRWSVSQTLEELGLEVAQAADGAGTISAIAGTKTGFDVVVLDLRLPDVDDLSLVGRVREMLPGALVVLMTAFGTTELVAGAFDLGVVGVLNKPFELAELSRLLVGDPAS